ncbi:MAG TPA: hypothetical protein VLU46_05125, partial [Thermoanaerobaculia bacterium]|nr:hypothetical protein [Thermoanaerobaculia bacterium]
LVIAVRCFVAMPQQFTTAESQSFGEALLTFDPYGHQPPPPAYPAYIAAGKLVNFFVRRALPSLLAVSVTSAIAGFVLFSIAFGRLLDAPLAGVAGAFALYVAPPVRFLCAHPSPEPLAFALVAAALLRSPAVFLALAVGVQPQLLAGAVAMLVVMRAGWRAFAAFGIVLAACFEPVIENIGAGRLDLYVSSIATENAPLAAPLEAFVRQPWSRATLVVFAAALVGAVLCFIRRNVHALPLAAFAVAHFAYACTFATRIESVRPFVPSLLGIAFFAAAALSWRRWKSPPSPW